MAGTSFNAILSSKNLSRHAFAQVYSTLMWVPSADMRLGRVEAGDMGPWWGKEDEEEVKEEWDE